MFITSQFSWFDITTFDGTVFTLWTRGRVPKIKNFNLGFRPVAMGWFTNLNPTKNKNKQNFHFFFLKYSNHETNSKFTWQKGPKQRIAKKIKTWILRKKIVTSLLDYFCWKKYFDPLLIKRKISQANVFYFHIEKKMVSCYLCFF